MVELIKKLEKKLLRLIFDISIKNKNLSKVITEINSYEVYEKKNLINLIYFFSKKITSQSIEMILSRQKSLIQLIGSKKWIKILYSGMWVLM